MTALVTHKGPSADSGANMNFALGLFTGHYISWAKTPHESASGMGWFKFDGEAKDAEAELMNRRSSLTSHGVRCLSLLLSN